jgi:hypothetical protein
VTLPGALGQILLGAAINALLVRSTGRLLRMIPAAERRAGEESGPAAGAIERAVAALVIASALVVCITSIGGTAGLLGSRPAMLGIGGALWLVVELATRRRRRVAPVSAPGAAASGSGGDAALWVAASAAAIPWLVLLCERLALPPVAWDALTYHLRFPALWIQTGHLTTAAAPEGDPSNPYYPLVGEMLLYWGLFTTGTDLWSSLSQVPFALAGALALAALAWRAGAGRKAGFLAALCWVATPGVVRQGVEAMVDVEQAALVLSALLFALCFREGGRRAWFLLAAASLGLLVGVKYSGLVYAAASVPFLVWAASGGRATKPLRPLGAGTWAAGVLLFAVLGGYSYARNLVAGGNPLLPLEVKLGGFTVFPGPTAPGYYFGAQSPRLGVAVFLASARSVLEMGPLFLPLLLCLPVAAAAGARQGTAPGAALARIAIVGMLALLLGGAVLPYREHRYFYAVTAIGWCAAAAVFGRFVEGRSGRWWAASFLVVEVPITLFYWGKDLIVAGPRAGHVAALLGVAAGAILLLRLRGRGRRRSSAAGPGGAVRGTPIGPVQAAIAATITLVILGAAYEPHKYDLWYRYWSTRHEWERLSESREDLRDLAESWRILAREDSRDTHTVAYAGMNAPYPLMGPGLRHRVVFVPRNGDADASFYDWGSPPPDPLTGGNARDWERNVERWGVRYLCVYRHMPGLRPEGRYPVERDWADADPGRFALVWEAPWARIYRVRDGGSRATARRGPVP